MVIEATPEEWAIVRQMLNRGCAHLGVELSQSGMTAAQGASHLLAVAALFDTRVAQAMIASPGDVA